MKTVAQVLSFRGTDIPVVLKEGQQWLLLNSLRNSLDVRVVEPNIRKSAFADHIADIAAMKGAPLEPAIPERYVYGWVAELRSPNVDFGIRKKECYDALMTHFHGISEERMTLMRDFHKIKHEARLRHQKLSAQPDFVQWEAAQSKLMHLGKQLKDMDKKQTAQLDLFGEEELIGEALQVG